MTSGIYTPSDKPRDPPDVERIARVMARKLGHNNHTGVGWEPYILAARGILNEPPRVSSDYIAMIIAEDARIEGGRIANVAYLAVKLATMVETGELQPHRQQPIRSRGMTKGIRPGSTTEDYRRALDIATGK